MGDGAPGAPTPPPPPHLDPGLITSYFRILSPFVLTSLNQLFMVVITTQGPLIFFFWTGNDVFWWCDDDDDGVYGGV